MDPENGELRDLSEEELKNLFSKWPKIEAFLNNPESIPHEFMEETIKMSWQKAAQQILNKIWKMKGAYYFYDPVDPVKFEIEDYFEVISKPMDLNSIKRNLSYNFYPSAREFVADMKLIWNNCYEYNGEDHEISLLAREM